MAASSAPAAKAALLDILRADPGMDDVGITYGHPGNAIQQDAIYFEQTHLDEAAVMLGQQRRDETYVLDLVVSIARDGDDPQGTEQRCWDLIAIIEDVLRPPLGPAGNVSARINNTLNQWAEVETIEMTPGIAINGGQRVAQATVGIRCRNRK